jgi:hypothetical protein
MIKIVIILVLLLGSCNKKVKDDKNIENQDLSEKSKSVKTKKKLSKPTNRKYSLYNNYFYNFYGEADYGTPIIVNKKEKIYYIYKGEKVIKYRKTGYSIFINDKIIGYDLGKIKNCTMVSNILKTTSKNIDYVKLSYDCLKNLNVLKNMGNLKSKNLMIVIFSKRYYQPKSKIKLFNHLEKIAENIKVLDLKFVFPNESFLKKAKFLQLLYVRGYNHFKLNGLENHKHLKIFKIKNTHINFNDFDILQTVKSLRVFHSSGYGFTKYFLRKLKGFKKIKELHLCNIEDADNYYFKFLKEFKDLENLKLCSNLKYAAKHIENLKKLKYINMENSSFTSDIRKILPSIKSLERLNINDLKNSTEEDFKTISLMENLKFLSARRIKGGIQKNKFKHLAKLKNLEILDISYNSSSYDKNHDTFGDGDLRYLENLKKLIYLNLKSTDTNAKNLPVTLKNLKYLNLNTKETIKMKSFERLSKFNNLEELKLSCLLDPDGIKYLGNLKKLKLLYLPSFKEFNLSVLSKLKNLVYLYINISKRDIKTLVKLGNLKNLEYLNLNSIFPSFEYFQGIEKLKKLRYIDINAKQIDFKNIRMLSKLNNLEFLKLEIQTPGLDSKVISEISKFKKLIELRLPEGKIYDKDFIKILSKMTHLNFLRFDCKNWNLKNKIVLVKGLNKTRILPELILLKGPFMEDKNCGSLKEIIYKDKKLGCGRIFSMNNVIFNNKPEEFVAVVKGSNDKIWKVYDEKGENIYTSQIGMVTKISRYKTNYLIMEIYHNNDYEGSWAIFDLKRKKGVVKESRIVVELLPDENYVAYLEKRKSSHTVKCFYLKSFKIKSVYSYEPSSYSYYYLSANFGGKGYRIVKERKKGGGSFVNVSCEEK